MGRVPFMSGQQVMEDKTMTPVLLMATPLACTPSLWAQQTKMADRLTMMKVAPVK